MNFMSWGLQPKAQRARPALNFPNQSRSLDAAHGCVSFWGYASTIEVSFQIGVDVLHQMAPSGVETHEGVLDTFDRNRTVIERAAGTAYSRDHATFCRLSRSDF